MEAVVRETTSLLAERYSIVILDLESGALLDYSRLGGIDPEEARTVVWEAYSALSSAKGVGQPVEFDLITDTAYVKVIIERDAGIVRGIVTSSSHLGISDSYATF